MKVLLTSDRKDNYSAYILKHDPTKYGNVKSKRTF